MLRKVPKQDCRVVLAHNPDTADTTARQHTDLFITGHTHGGQVYIPAVGTPVLPVRNKTYSSGLKKSRRGENVFICRGVGWSILPVRFLCPPEIALLELVPAGSQEAEV
jgi:predicted MPP superfamily phosphohydrolase